MVFDMRVLYVQWLLHFQVYACVAIVLCCAALWCDVLLCDVMLCALICYAAIRYVLLCYVLLRHAICCDVPIYYVMICEVMLRAGFVLIGSVMLCSVVVSSSDCMLYPTCKC